MTEAETKAATGMTEEQAIAEYAAMTQEAAAKAWLAGKAPQWMYEPPFFQGFIMTNRNTGEEFHLNLPASAVIVPESEETNVIDQIVRVTEKGIEVNNGNFFQSGQKFEVCETIDAPALAVMTMDEETAESYLEQVRENIIRIKGGVPDFVKKGMLLRCFSGTAAYGNPKPVDYLDYGSTALPPYTGEFDDILNELDKPDE